MGQGQSHPLSEALDSDHARYITSKIAQHARSMATGTRSLPTDSLVPYFQPIGRGHMSEGGLSDNSQRVVFLGGIRMSHCMLLMYHQVVLNTTPLLQNQIPILD